MSIYLKRAAVILALMTALVAYLTVKLYKRDFEGAFSTVNAGIVVIDAGHGQPDGGAVSADGVMEEKINLAIAKKVSAILENRCYNVIMTRVSHDGIHTSGNTVREKKLSDMKRRAEIMNESGAEAFISIHMNKFSDPTVFGAQVFYSGNALGSEQLGLAIQDELLKIDEKNKRVAKCAENTIYLMKNAKIPAVIVECGFLSNREEASMLNDEAYRDKLAVAIADGICKYFEEGNAL